MSPAGLPGLDVARAIKREVERTQLRARKGIELIARRPPPMISMTPKDEVWALGKATLWRYRRPEARQRAAGHAVPRSRRRLGHLRSSSRYLLGREAARRGFRRLPLRLGQARGRRGRPHPRHVPQWVLRPCRRRRASHRGDGRGRAGRLLHGGADAPVAARQPRRRSGGATSSCSRHRATSSMPRRSSTTSARDGCSLRTPSTRRPASCRRAPSAACSARSNRRPESCST